MAGDELEEVFADRKTVLRQFHAGIRGVGELHGAPALQQGVAGGWNTRHSAAEQPVAHRDLSAGVFSVPIDGGELGRFAGSVDGPDLLLGRDVHKDIGIAADSGHGGVGNGERSHGGYGGVKSVAAFEENSLRRLGRLRLAGGNRIFGAAENRPGGHGLNIKRLPAHRPCHRMPRNIISLQPGTSVTLRAWKRL